MQLATIAEVVQWPEAHYIFSSRKSARSRTMLPALYKAEPQIYRAGVSVAIKPCHLPSGLVEKEVRGGKYFCFIYTGSIPTL